MSNQRKKQVPKVQDVVELDELERWVNNEIEPPKKVGKFKTIRIGDKDLGWIWKDVEIEEEK
jgi:hypothetical protein